MWMMLGTAFTRMSIFHAAIISEATVTAALTDAQRDSMVGTLCVSGGGPCDYMIQKEGRHVT